MAEVKKKKKRSGAQYVDVMGITHATSLVDMTQGRAMNKTDFSSNTLHHTQVDDKLLAVTVAKKKDRSGDDAAAGSSSQSNKSR